MNFNNIRLLSNNLLSDNPFIEINEKAILKISNSIEPLEKFLKDNSLIPFTKTGDCIFFCSISYCFTNPYTNKPYYYKNNNVTKERSKGLIAAFSQSNINWNSLDEVINIKNHIWLDLLKINSAKDLYQCFNRLRIIKNFAKYLKMRKYKTVDDLLFSITNVNELSDILLGSGYFTDEFFKKGQMAIYFMSCLRKQKIGKPYIGIEKLTCMADYRLPQLLYNTKAVTIKDKHLLEKLESKSIFNVDSYEVKVLRASVIKVGEILSKKLKLIEPEVDQLLWKFVQNLNDEGKLNIPAMLIPTDKF